MQKVKLENYVEQIRGVSYKPTDLFEKLEVGSVILLRANNIFDSKVNFEDVVYVDKNKVKNNQFLRAGDILICTSSGSKDLVGKAAYIENDLNVTFGAFCKVIRPKGIESAFLGHFFQSQIYRHSISESCIGVNINNIRGEHIDNLEIPLPSLSEQKAIAEKLDKVSILIEKRKQQLCLLDTLVKSKFVEMFGSFPDNPRGWNIGTIKDVVSDVRYGSSRPAIKDGKYKYLRMNNITYDGELDLSDIKYIDVPDNELSKCAVRRGDVLFNRTNSKELVGKTCVYDQDEMMVLAGFIIRVRVNDQVLPEFLSAFLNTRYSKQMLLGMCKAAIGQANINAQEMQNIKLYIPPIEFQDRFVQLKNRTKKSKEKIKQSLSTLELLKKSLMQKYFG